MALSYHVRGGPKNCSDTTRILIITDAWLPQVNGVVRSIEVLVREAPALGVEIEIPSR